MSPFTAYAIFGAAGVQLAASVVGGLFLGHFLDAKLETEPWCMLLGIIGGFLGGMVNMIRIVGRYQRSRDDGKRSG